VTALRHRLVPASDPGAEPACRLTREDGQRRQANTGRLFDRLAEQRQTARGHEFVFRGEPEALWEEVTLFVDEESQCCPFFTFEQFEEADGVTLRVLNPPSPVTGP
jgi:hypothetical protein